MARPTIRLARDRDARALRGVIAEANEEFRGQVPDAFFRSYLSSVLDVDARLSQGAMVFIAEHRGVLVGSISYYRDANDEGMNVDFPAHTAGIRATAVHPGARGLGIGRGLVDACLDRARADDSTGIALHTAAFMRAAIRLYQASGFQRASAFDYPVGQFFPSDPGEQMVATAYLRDLGTDLAV